MHAVRLARAATGRDRIIKMEGGYHGLHDSVLVSLKPKASEIGDPKSPTSVPGGSGIPKATVQNTLVAQFNDIAGIERLFAKYPGEIAAVIVEPIMMNVGILMPDEGYHQALREITKKNGALLIFDEVKTGAKLAYGGACEYFARETGHRLSGEIHRRRLFAGGFCLHAASDGPNFRSQSLSRRHLQHQSRRHGRGHRHFSRGVDEGRLHARHQAQQETCSMATTRKSASLA